MDIPWLDYSFAHWWTLKPFSGWGYKAALNVHVQVWWTEPSISLRLVPRCESPGWFGGVCLTRHCRAALFYTPTSNVWVIHFCHILSNSWCWILHLNKNFSHSHMWMASRTQWTWIGGNCRRQWRTGKPGVLQPTVRVGRDLATEQEPQKYVWRYGRCWDLNLHFPDD